MVKQLQNLDLALNFAHHIEILYFLSVQDLNRNNVTRNDMFSPYAQVDIMSVSISPCPNYIATEVANRLGRAPNRSHSCTVLWVGATTAQPHTQHRSTHPN